MKKFFSLLAVLALVGMAGTAFAESFTSDSKTAIATFRSGEIGFSATLYNWNSTYTGATATNITWTTSDVPLGSSTEKFKCADVYALLESNITVPNAKVYVYQDNKHNTTTEYVAGAGRVVSEVTRYDGLVKSGGTGYADLTFRCVELSKAKTEITDLPEAWPSWEPYSGVRRFVDKGNSDWATQKTGSDIILATTDGIWCGEQNPSTVWWKKEPVVMFFGAQFVNVLGGDTFGTNTITFNTSVE